jgi:dimethylhistidine N-methyltransferase
MRRFSLAEMSPLMQVAAFLEAAEPAWQVVPVDQGGAPDRMRREVGQGLADRRQPWLSPTYFYDAQGSRLYEVITTLPEYYPTRTEAGLLAAIAGELSALCAPAEVVELGSGSSTKTETVLTALGASTRPLTYLPIDVSPTMLHASARRLVERFARLRVLGLAGTYEEAFKALPPATNRLFMFLGGTIGNFPQAYQESFFAHLAAVMRPGNRLLLGFDRRAHAGKPATVIEAAYDDSRGVTAQFNLNMLTHLNAALEADFDTRLWAHQSRYDAETHQVEMYLVSLEDQVVTIPGLGRSYVFRRGTRILTEISRKFDPDELAAWFEARGFQRVRHWGDERDYVGMLLLERQKGSPSP